MSGQKGRKRNRQAVAVVSGALGVTRVSVSFLWEPEGAVSLCDAVRQTFCNGKNVSELVATCGY